MRATPKDWEEASVALLYGAAVFALAFTYAGYWL